MTLKIDHVVILVRDLVQAVQDYQALGFTVTPGGEHTGGATHNALIAFADGAYLELIAFRRPNPEHRWFKYSEAGEGLIDFALLPTDIGADLAAARQQGLLMAGPTEGGRLRPDGQALRWQTGTPLTPDLPFMCGDVTLRALRVPAGSVWQHANGATGIAVLTVAVANLAVSARRYRALLGLPAPIATTSAASGISGQTEFVVGPSRISLQEVGPKADPALIEYVFKRGEGPFSLTLHHSISGQPHFNPALTHGVNFKWG